VYVFQLFLNIDIALKSKKKSKSLITLHFTFLNVINIIKNHAHHKFNHQKFNKFNRQKFNNIIMHVIITMQL